MEWNSDSSLQSFDATPPILPLQYGDDAYKSAQCHVVLNWMERGKMKRIIGKNY
jgi:hypothetical protein